MQELLAFIVVAGVIVGVGVVAQRRIGGRFGQLVFLALVVRIVGSTLRIEVMNRVYGGNADAVSYFSFGQIYAERIADLDFHFFLGDVYSITPDRWWGSQFIRSVTAIVVFVVGDNLRATFLVFSCFAFGGLYLLVRAFEDSRGPESRDEFAKWVWFWPSLWFWPSSIGKEALITPAMSLVVWGYVGRNGAPRWLGVLAGLALAVAVRPHVGMVFALAVAVAELLRRRRGPRSNVLSMILFVAVAALSIRFGLSQLGLADADLEGIEEFFDHRAANTEQGGSQISRASGVLAIPMGLINVFFRPFPWEGRGIQILSSVEIWLFWFVLWRRRHGLGVALRRWREDRFLAVAAPLALALALMYGLAFANLGIIARQRVVVLPFLLCLLAIPRGAPVAAGPHGVVAPDRRLRGNAMRSAA